MRKASGFTLIEITVVLVIAAFVIAMFATVGSSLLAQQKRSITMNRLAAIDAALVQYVMQQRRLPCPANGTLTTSDPGAGNEVLCTTLPGQGSGVVPWTALGLAEQDVVDGWGRRFTYRVDNTLVTTGKMDMSWCDPAGIASLVGGVCTTACTGTASTCTPPTTYLSGKGLTIKNAAGATLTSTATPNTAAAYVLISHGETGGGGYLSTGQLATSTGTDGTEEQKNYANAQLSAGYYYVDSDMVGIDGASHFDDVVLRPTIMSVVTRAGLGPRAH
jgi:prepilin-type N-terminal cleavage/methylation domain-containing protein